MTAFTESDGALRAEYRFPDFAEAFAFATRVAALADLRNHHPELTIGWGYVRVTLTSHDAGDTVTDRDRSMAEAIENLRSADQDQPSGE